MVMVQLVHTFYILKLTLKMANGENYEKKWYEETKKLVGEYIDHHTSTNMFA